jgi:hypothetical protein
MPEMANMAYISVNRASWTYFAGIALSCNAFHANRGFDLRQTLGCRRTNRKSEECPEIPIPKKIL